MRSILPHILRTLAAGADARLADATRLEDAEVAWLIDNGLAPIAHHLRPEGGYHGDAGPLARLRGAELTARYISADVREGATIVIEALTKAGLESCLLKGLATGLHRYPAFHLRTLGDLDIVVSDGVAAASALAEIGFEVFGPTIPHHHHLPGMRHPDLGVVVEVHERLRPPWSPSAASPPFDSADLIWDGPTSTALGMPVRLLPVEVELALIADSWCQDLRTRFGIAGLQRPLLDAVLLIRDDADGLDWERIGTWADGTHLGACLTVLLGYLQRHDALSSEARHVRDVTRGQRFVRWPTLGIVHRLVDRYLAGPVTRGRLASDTNMSIVFGTLIAARSPWRSLASVPWRVAFPPGLEVANSPSVVWRRVRSALSGR